MVAMTALDTSAVVVSESGGAIRVASARYSLVIEDTGPTFFRSPYALLSGSDGTPWMDINLLSSVHTTAMPDEVWDVSPPVVTERDGIVRISVLTKGTSWDVHELQLECTADTVELTVLVSGSARIADVTLFGADASLSNGASGTFRSAMAFASVFAPIASEPVQLVRPARAAVSLGVTGDADPGRLNAVFSPPPLVLGLGRQLPLGATDMPGGDWLGMSVREAVEKLTFSTLRYEPLDSGFLLRLPYDGHTVVDGEWQSPTIVLRPAHSGWDVLDDHREDLIAHGFASVDKGEAEAWWREPIFCGWGAQCARSAHELHRVPPDADTDPESEAEENTVVRSAPNLARQDVYDEFLATLEANDIRPGTIVIDDRWQAEYGTATADLDHWPDLRGWIAAKHAEGHKVLLWWKAWDPQGIPLDECVTDAAGRPIAVDPGNPAYLDRLRAIIHSLLSADGMDADGFKIDFTQRTPSGRTLQGTDNVWGIAALHRLLDTIHTAAKDAKQDALVICHAVHPSFATVCDMVRLNDVSKYDIHHERVPVVDQLTFRNEIARRTLPGHVIDTDQWPMPNRAEWLHYAQVQGTLGVPALYYVESIDRSGEKIHAEDLAVIAETWRDYRERIS
jgi:hypothetical protein